MFEPNFENFRAQLRSWFEIQPEVWIWCQRCIIHPILCRIKFKGLVSWSLVLFIGHHPSLRNDLINVPIASMRNVSRVVMWRSIAPVGPPTLGCWKHRLSHVFGCAWSVQPRVGSILLARGLKLMCTGNYFGSARTVPVSSTSRFRAQPLIERRHKPQGHILTRVRSRS